MLCFSFFVVHGVVVFPESANIFFPGAISVKKKMHFQNAHTFTVIFLIYEVTEATRASS